MTIEQKNLILGFLDYSRINKDLENFEDEIKDKISDIIDILPSKEKIKGVELENKLYKFIDLIKIQYFDFGIYADQTIENMDLKWTPQGYKKDVRENDNK